MRETFRLLVVDDEPGVRSNLLRALRGCGFTAEEAADGNRAAEMIRSSTVPFDLLITDVVMPGRDGFELAKLTATLSPATRILLMSAYVPDAGQTELQHLPFLQKPFHLNLFLDTVRELLNSFTPPRSFPPVLS